VRDARTYEDAQRNSSDERRNHNAHLDPLLSADQRILPSGELDVKWQVCEE
jgi:hypothetical protein